MWNTQPINISLKHNYITMDLLLLFFLILFCLFIYLIFVHYITIPNLKCYILD